MVDLSELNSEQRLGAETLAGPVLILAGAGTGKTRVITSRIAHMLAMGIAPEAIAAMTFTNKAAREMAERVEALVGKKKAGAIRIGTFHSFCLQILRDYGDRIGLLPRFAIASTSDQVDLLGRALKEETAFAAVNVEALHGAISKAKNALLTPLEFGKLSSQYLLGIDGDLCTHAYDLYERQLSLNRLIDFDDCILKAVRILEGFPEVRSQLEIRYRYLLVDEFQDTNEGQFRVLELIGAGHKNVCVVGDDDQSIYSWRGAMYETLERFEKVFTGTRLIKLEQNYRCTNTILKAANTVIRNNVQRKDKSLWSESRAEYPLVVERQESEEAEARWIAQKCMTLIGDGHRPADVAVLYRANNQAKLIELALRELSIPYETFGGSSFFERKEVKDFLCYIRLISKPHDRLAFWRIVNTPHRGIGLKSLERIEASARKSGRSPFEEALGHSSELGLSTKSLEALAGFIESVKVLQALKTSTPEDIRALGERVIKTFHLEQDIRNNTVDAASRERKIDNLRSLPIWLESAAKDMERLTGTLEVDGLLDRLTLGDKDISDKEEGVKANKVSLMTIHASKGLEFPVVFLCGLEEELFPHKNSLGSIQGVSEERRLFYVALTRAKLRLFLTWAFERGTGAFKTTRQASRFLKEIPKEILDGLVEGDAIRTPSAEERMTKTLSSLAKLRASIATVTPSKK